VAAVLSALVGFAVMYKRKSKRTGEKDARFEAEYMREEHRTRVRLC
jgi:hypothetical protein